MVDKTSSAVVLKPDKTSFLLVCGVLCFSRMPTIYEMISLSSRSAQKISKVTREIADNIALRVDVPYISFA